VIGVLSHVVQWAQRIGPDRVSSQSPGWLGYCVPIVQTVLVAVMPSVPPLSDR
jgi:hypothetical protein